MKPTILGPCSMSEPSRTRSASRKERPSIWCGPDPGVDQAYEGFRRCKELRTAERDC